MDRALYARLWRDDRTESLALYLEPGVASDPVRAAFVRLAGPGRLLHVTPNQALRKRVLLVFDETVPITWVLQTIAVFVSVLGVISTLTTLVLQRRRELAVLRAAGAQRGPARTPVAVGDPWVVGRAVSLMPVTAIFAGLVPARLAAGRATAGALRVE